MGFLYSDFWFENLSYTHKTSTFKVHGKTPQILENFGEGLL